MARPRKPRSAQEWADRIWRKELALRDVPETYYRTTLQILDDDKWLLRKARERVNADSRAD